MTLLTNKSSNIFKYVKNEPFGQFLNVSYSNKYSTCCCHCCFTKMLTPLPPYLYLHITSCLLPLVLIQTHKLGGACSEFNLMFQTCFAVSFKTCSKHSSPCLKTWFCKNKWTRCRGKSEEEGGAPALLPPGPSSAITFLFSLDQGSMRFKRGTKQN